MKDIEILESFSENVTTFLSTNKMQCTEITLSLGYIDAYNIVDPKDTPRRADKKSKANLPLTAAIIRAVAGSEIMRDRHIDIVAIDNEQYDTDADIMDAAVDYAQHASMWKSNRAVAVRDAAACGIGATVTNLDMTKRDFASGVPSCRRIFPLFLFWDNAARGNDINANGNFCGYVDPMRPKDLTRYIEQQKKGSRKKESVVAAGADFSGQFLQHLRDGVNYECLYHYFWRDFVNVYDVQNPFAQGEEEAPSQISEILVNDDLAMEIMTKFTDEVNLDLDASYWTLDEDEMTKLEETIGAIATLSASDISLQSSSRKVYCYYRAEIARGQILTMAKSYSQEEYPLNFVTGYYDEKAGVFYGLCRHLSPIQDLINEVTDNLTEYSRTAATGGKIYIKGAKDDIKLIKQHKANEEDVTPLPRDAEIIPKELAESPQVLLQFLQMLMEWLPRAIGIGQEFLGVITSGDMTDSLYGRVMRQSYAVLEDFANSSAGYSRRQGVLFRDLMLGIARAEDGRILPVLSPDHEKEDYIRLTKQNLARQYVVRVIERPITEDEKAENTKILMQLLPQLAGVGVDVSAAAPLLIKQLPMDASTRQQWVEAFTPQPQQPNPLDEAAAQANVKLLEATAAKYMSEANEKNATLAKQPPLDQSEIIKNLAMAKKYSADAMHSPQQQGKS